MILDDSKNSKQTRIKILKKFDLLRFITRSLLFIFTMLFLSLTCLFIL